MVYQKRLSHITVKKLILFYAVLVLIIWSQNFLKRYSKQILMIYSKFVFALYAFSGTSWIFLDLLADESSLCSLICISQFQRN